MLLEGDLGPYRVAHLARHVAALAPPTSQVEIPEAYRKLAGSFPEAYMAFVATGRILYHPEGTAEPCGSVCS